MTKIDVKYDELGTDPEVGEDDCRRVCRESVKGI